METFVQITNSPSETIQLAKDFALKIKAPVLIGLSGELGTGKTIFAKGFAEGLGIKELITSPTFLGVSESYSGAISFTHMDFYKKVISKENIMFYLQKKSVVLIEWVENYYIVFKEKLKLDFSVYIQYLKDNEGNILDDKRQISIEQVIKQ